MKEVELSGGNVADRVVRIGDTVRKPATASTTSIEAFLEHLHCVGFRGAPRTLGRDELGRHVLEYIPGATMDMSSPPSSLELFRVGRMIREFHIAAASFVPPASAHWSVAIPPPGAASHICHNDLAPWNLVRDGDRWVFIDWDGSGPGSVLWDLAYAAQSFVPLQAGGRPEHDAIRLRALVDGYALDGISRKALPQLMVERTRAMYQLLKDGAESGRQPWAQLYQAEHGQHWQQAADYVEQNLSTWERLLAP